MNEILLWRLAPQDLLKSWAIAERHERSHKVLAYL
jgi:hypothetical protein